jgi:hypothetical protein
MRVDPDAEGIRHVGDLFAFRNAARGAEIGLHDIDQPFGQ